MKMPSTIGFVKMHGLGNDFVIVKREELSEQVDYSAVAKKIADLNFGFGCDQFILYEQHEELHKNLIYNQHVSQATMFGNVTRCFAKLIFLHSKDSIVSLKAHNKSLSCKIVNEDEISVNVGPVNFNQPWMSSQPKVNEFFERHKVSSNDKLQDKDLFVDGVNLVIHYLYYVNLVIIFII